MHRFGGVVIPMMDRITFLMGTPEILEKIKNQKAMQIFDPETLTFLKDLAGEIRRCREKTADLAAYGFWLAHVCGQEQQTHAGENRVGRGVSLHFAASNMPMLFAYSMTAALLSGNCVVMRLSKKETVPEKIFLKLLGEVLARHRGWEERIVLVRYEHDKGVNDWLSHQCDVRVIWGKDTSVQELQKSPLGKDAVDVVFPDRGSVAVIDANAILEQEDLFPVANAFYNDTYAYDQNACSSPSILYWIGKEREVQKAQKAFWNAVEAYAGERYQVPDVLAVKKWEMALFAAAGNPGVKIQKQGNLIVRVTIPELSADCWGYRVPGGFFMESTGEELEGLLPVLNHKCQAVSVFGCEMESVKKLDVLRVTSLGHALDFSLNWDGIDLIAAMSHQK